MRLAKLGSRNHFFGKKHSDRTKKILSERKRGNKNPNYGKDFSNEKNPGWKGYEPIHYIALHRWVRRHLPKPTLCQMCEKVPPYDLANITGVYNRDFSNWQYICRRCHMLSDGRMYNLRNQNIRVL